MYDFRILHIQFVAEKKLLNILYLYRYYFIFIVNFDFDLIILYSVIILGNSLKYHSCTMVGYLITCNDYGSEIFVF